jgi:hypothetical protein
MKKDKPTKYYWAFAIALMAAINFAVAASDRENEIQRYVDVFSKGTPIDQKQACEQLSWEGLSDPRLFDVIEHNLQQTYKTAGERQSADLAAWQAKALAYSGQEKYRATLQAVEHDGATRGMRSHAKAALELLPAYARWNPIISDTSQPIPGKDAEINRLANMLRSGDKGLQEIAAQRIIEKPIRDNELFAILQKAVEPDINKEWSGEDIKSVAYMLKALAGSGQAEYIATVRQAADHATDAKVRNYARGYVSKL